MSETGFKKLGLSAELLKAIEEHGISEPTEIQEKTIPLVLSGKDVIAKSATGSGKTLAFGAGIIDNVKPGEGVQALILTPTRELAEQVGSSLRQFAIHTPLGVKEVYGGVSYGEQERALKKVEIVVGTPGRILDHLSQRTLDLSKLKFLVLDEADKMFDMGFIKDITKIISICPVKRQTLLFSATLSSTIRHLADRYMNDPKEVSVESYVEASKLKQYFYDVPQNQKFSLLVHLLEQEKGGLVMVFSNTRHNTDFLANNLDKHGFDVMAIHGGVDQNKRNRIMEKFHSSHVCILVCTDVAARGLDIKNVSHIYNYDLPPTPSEYIHRIGRTARAGKEGVAISLVSKMDYENFQRIYADERLEIQSMKLPDFKFVRIFMDSRRPRSFNNRGYRPGKHRSVDRHRKRQLGRRG